MEARGGRPQCLANRISSLQFGFALLVLFVAKNPTLCSVREKMNAIDPRLARVCEGYRRAVLEKDVAAFLALYHPEARVFDTWGVWSYEGDQPQREAGRLIPADQQSRTGPTRRKVIEEWFSSLGAERVAVTFDRLQATVTGDLACLTARVIYAAISADGVELRRMQNRLTWVLQPAGDAWQIIHEHTSVPIGSDLKGILAVTG
ncbi:MAG: hypothetical protein JWQ62_929 [Lacunisphaera sp.]|nr:hypothetical protein [Lacunisphaera sp.]